MLGFVLRSVGRCPAQNLSLDSLPEVVIFVRHSPDCQFKDEGEQYRGCRCRKHLRYSYRGEQKRLSAKTRSWVDAEKQRTTLLRQFRVTEDPVLEPTDRTTISQAVETFLTRKRTENASAGVVKKYDRELHSLVSFCSARGKLFPEALTLTLLEEFRATWAAKYPSTQSMGQCEAGSLGLTGHGHLEEVGFEPEAPFLITGKGDEMFWRG